jgi:hypothetical protein
VDPKLGSPDTGFTITTGGVDEEQETTAAKIATTLSGSKISKPRIMLDYYHNYAEMARRVS